MEKQEEHAGYAIIGLGIMCLSTTLVQIYASPKLWNSDKPRTGREDLLFVIATFFLFPATVAIWAIGVYFWYESFTYISVVQRNNSLIGGIGAANIGLVCTRLWVPSATANTYIAYSMWPAYLGLIAGALVDPLTSFTPYGCVC